MAALPQPGAEPFRIFEEGDAHDAVVAIHGWITEPAVGELLQVLASKGPGVRLDLSQLLGADHASLAALRRLRADGVLLIGASPYIELLLG